MASDEELRKVAEDMRALARSLARDFWEAAHTARGSGRSTSEAFRRGIRDAVHGATDEFRHGMRYGRGRGGFYRPRHGWGPPPPRYGPPPAGEGPYGSQPPGEPHRYAGPGPQGAPPWGRGGWWAPAPPRGRARPGRHREPPPPIRRKWDASLLAAALVVVFGAAWLLSSLGALHVATEAVLAGGLMLLGAALIVTARTDWSLSRHAWPVVVGVVLVAGLFATSTSFGVTGALSHVSFGDMRSAAPQGGGTVYGGFGQLTVDAGSVRPGATLHVESVAGETRIDLAPGQTAVVQGKVLAGQVCVDGRSYASGIGASSPAVTVGTGQGPAVNIDIHQLAGQVVVGTPGCHQP